MHSELQKLRDETTLKLKTQLEEQYTKDLEEKAKSLQEHNKAIKQGIDKLDTKIKTI